MSLKFVTGKGGVGKTRVSLLLHQLDPTSELAGSSVACLEESARLGLSTPRMLELGAEQLIADFLSGVIPFGALVRWASRRQLVQNLLYVAPHLDELLLLHQWIQRSKDRNLIVDGSSTGNFLGIMEAIPTALRMFDGGRLRNLAEDVQNFLGSSRGVEVWLVSIPENSALQEMDKLQESLRKLYPNLIIKRILNRFHPTYSDLDPGNEWEGFFRERPRKEIARIEGRSFDRRLDEGATRW